MKKRLMSIQHRLLTWLLILLSALWGVLWFNNQQQIERSAEQNIDNQLNSTAELILIVQQRYDSSQLGPLLKSFETIDTETVGQTIADFELLNGANVLMRTEDFPSISVPAREGFQDIAIDDQLWRIYTRVDSRNSLVVRTAFNADRRTANAEVLKSDFGSPLLWFLPALALAALISVWRGLIPLHRLEKQVALIDPNDPQPLKLSEQHFVPNELQRFVQVLDQFLVKVRNVHLRQRAFTASAAHELRTPLAGCMAQLRLAEHGLDSRARRRAFERMFTSLNHMSELIRRLLLLARLDSSGSGLNKQPVALDDIARTVIEQQKTNADDAGVMFELQLPMHTLSMQGEPTLLYIMLSNPIENALRASSTGSLVKLSISQKADHFLIVIRDYGIGIAEEDREHVFTPFHRGGNGIGSSHDSGSGSGLGLTIMRAIVDAHAGDITLDDTQNNGTQLSIRLPF